MVDPLVLFLVSYYYCEDESSAAGADIFIDDSDVTATRAKQALNIKNHVQFSVIVLLFALSLYQKAHREDICHDFKDDPINNKLEEIK